MPQDNNDIKELIKSMMDVREWLVRLDTKLDGMEEVKKVTYEAKDTAEDAYNLSKFNEEQIRNIKANTWKQWTLFLTILGAVVAILRVI